ncbi:DUF86 domain-containing protein [Persephonella sp.]
MIDTQFLNEKATKFKSALKKVKQIMDRGSKEFVETPMYPDRVQYYMIIAYDELDQIMCHLLKEILNIKKKENCIEDIASQDIFSGKVSRALIDFYNFRQNIFKTKFNYSPEQMFFAVKNILDNLYDQFIPELASLVKELKSKEPQLKIPVNLKKVNEQAKAVKSAVKKIQTFLNYSYDEFQKNPLFIDRTRYFLVVAIDSSLWICRHILRKLKLPTKDCFKTLSEKGIISLETGEKMSLFASKRDEFANPQIDIDTEELYKIIKDDLEYFLKFLKEISKAIFKDVKK